MDYWHETCRMRILSCTLFRHSNCGFIFYLCGHRNAKINYIFFIRIIMQMRSVMWELLAASRRYCLRFYQKKQKQLTAIRDKSLNHHHHQVWKLISTLIIIITTIIIIIIMISTTTTIIIIIIITRCGSLYQLSTCALDKSPSNRSLPSLSVHNFFEDIIIILRERLKRLLDKFVLLTIRSHRSKKLTKIPPTIFFLKTRTNGGV